MHIIFDARHDFLDIAPVYRVGDQKRICRIRCRWVQTELESWPALTDERKPVAYQRLLYIEVGIADESIYAIHDFLTCFDGSSERHFQLCCKYRIFRWSDKLLANVPQPENRDSEKQYNDTEEAIRTTQRTAKQIPIHAIPTPFKGVILVLPRMFHFKQDGRNQRHNRHREKPGNHQRKANDIENVRCVLTHSGLGHGNGHERQCRR